MKYLCENCGWHGEATDAYQVEIPQDDYAVAVCPECLAVFSTLVAACDEPGCWKIVTAGTPTGDGYRQTCSVHDPG